MKLKTSLSTSRKNLTLSNLKLVTLSAFFVASLVTAHGQDLYISDLYGNSVSEYDTSGNSIAAPLLSNTPGAYGLALSGNDLYVSNYSGDSVTEYNTTTGLAVGNAPLITQGLDNPTGLYLDGDDLYVANQGTSRFSGSVTEYNALTGAEIGGAPLITGLTLPESFATSGNTLFISSWNSVNEYNATTGAFIGDITGMSNARGIAINGNILYVADSYTNTVDEFNIKTGCEISSDFITGLNNPHQIAYDNGDLYISDVGSDSINVYDATTGAQLNNGSMLICANNPYNFILAGSDPGPAVPEPNTWALVLAGLFLLAYLRRVRARSENPSSL